jgi:hypothetical protein
MKDYTQITQSTELQLQVSLIYTRIASLRKELVEAKAQLLRILRSEWSASSSEAKELRDRIFGYRIELEVLEVRAHRLLKQIQVQDQDTADV